MQIIEYILKIWNGLILITVGTSHGMQYTRQLNPERHSHQLKKGLRPFRAYIQFVDNFTGRCPVLLMMPFQGNNFYFTLSPKRALALAQGIALRIKYEGSNKSPEGAQAIDQILKLTAMFERVAKRVCLFFRGFSFALFSIHPRLLILNPLVVIYRTLCVLTLFFFTGFAAAQPPVDSEGRPLIEKIGTIDCDLVETTPVLFKNKVYRFEYVRAGYWNNQTGDSYFRFVDHETGRTTSPFAKGFHLGSAFVYHDTVYVTAVNKWDGERIFIFTSTDLNKWDQWMAFELPGYGIFNTSMIKAENEFVLMFEIGKPKEEAGVPFTAHFATSTDLKKWKILSAEHNYARDRYTAPHCLRHIDGYFYDFYLEENHGYEMRVVRSKDLISWEPSPLNPVLKSSAEDKQIISKSLPDSLVQRIATAENCNNSDIDFCEYKGKLIINYSWGNQRGQEFLAEAIYHGTQEQFIKGWFPVRLLPERGLCAHRGAMKSHPENTISAFSAAVNAGAHMIEFDVQLTKDCKMVVIHDGTVDRTTNGKGKVSDLTLSEIKKLDAGSWKAPEFANERIPTLQEVLSVMPYNIWLNIHVKGEGKLPEQVARLILKQGRMHQAFLACTAKVALQAKEAVPGIMICNMERQDDGQEYVSATINAKTEFIQLRRKNNPQFADLVKQLKTNGIRVNYYGTDSPDEIRMLFETGVDFPLVNDIVGLMEVAGQLNIQPVAPVFKIKN